MILGVSSRKTHECERSSIVNEPETEMKNTPHCVFT